MTCLKRRHRMALALVTGIARAAPAIPVAAQLAAHRAGVQTSALDPPLYFEENLGQAPTSFGYVARSAGYAVGVSSSRFTVASAAAGEPIEVVFVGARDSASLEALGATPGRSNYLLGRDTTKWVRDARHYERVLVRGLYDGIDVVHYGDPQRLEFDFKIAPHANPAQIALAVPAGAHVDSDGNLALSAVGTPGPALVRPRAFQRIGGETVEIAAEFRSAAGSDGHARGG